MDQAVKHIVGDKNMNIGLSKQSFPRKENVLRTHDFVTQGQKAWPPLFHRSKNVTGISCFEPDNLVLASICILHMKISKNREATVSFFSLFQHLITLSDEKAAPNSLLDLPGLPLLILTMPTLTG